MIHYAVAFGLLAHVLFWGAGAAMLAMPRPWRRFWPVLVVPAGLALQSAVVWFGALAGLRGTNSYVWPSEAIPVALLALAFWRWAREGGWSEAWRMARNDIERTGLVWAAVAGCLMILVLPLAIASKGLTSLSLGSCDAADYAAGARVLMEFAREDRSGFLGLTEVVRVHSVDNFFDYWLRLNHFTPAALMAFNGSVLGCAPHETATLMTMVLLAGLLPTVFWVSRAVVGYSGGGELDRGGALWREPRDVVCGGACLAGAAPRGPGDRTSHVGGRGAVAWAAHAEKRAGFCWCAAGGLLADPRLL